MGDDGRLVERFEAERGRLRGIAYRMLGSGGEAEDAVQEAWLRLARVDAGEIASLGGWLRTVVARICLDVLRARREEPVAELPERAGGAEPEDEAVLADAVGRALLVVLDRLGAEERVAFVLHDMLAVPFAEIAPIVGRTPVTAKKLASRARQKVRGAPMPDPAGRRALVDAFLAASRAGDVPGVVALLAPDVVRRTDAAGRTPEIRGAAVIEEIRSFGRTARYADAALINGAPGVVVAPYGRLRTALTFAFADGRISAYELITGPERLARLDVRLTA